MSGLSVFRLVGNVSVNGGYGVAEVAEFGLPASMIKTGRFTNDRLPLEPQITGNLTPSANSVYSLGNAAYQWRDLHIGGEVTGNLTPSANVTYSLGSADKRWKDLYLSGNTLYLGDTVLSAGEVAGTMRVHDIADPGNTAAIVLTQTAATVAGNAVAVGLSAGISNQGSETVGIGYVAGRTSQNNGATAVGTRAGQSNQGVWAVAVGAYSGNDAQGSCAVAIGRQAGQTSQNPEAIAIGRTAGLTNQGTVAIAIGTGAGASNQGNLAVAIGRVAGFSGQGSNSIAIGSSAGLTNQASNSIVINATGGTLNNTTANSCVIKPVRDRGETARAVMLYEESTGEVTTSTNGMTIDASGNVSISSMLNAGIPGEIRFVRHDGVTSRYNRIENSVNTGASNNYMTFDVHNGTQNSATNVMTLRGDGSVGIGTTAPAYTLDVSGTARITSNLYFNNQTQNNIITLYGTTGLADTGQYGFGINSSTLRYNAPATAIHRWYSGTTITMTLGSTGNLNIAGTYSPSDTRIKKNIRDLDDVEALGTLRLLKPVAYGYVDAEGRGFETTDEVIGFIAQDVAAILPHAVVTKNTSFVPSVFAPAVRVAGPEESSSTMIFSLENNEKEIPFGPGSRVQIIWYDDEGRKDAVVTCISVPTPTSFECEPEPGSLEIPENIIVLGHEVDDFHTLKKDVIFTVAAAATQELDRQLQAARSEISDLKDRAHDLEAQIASQTELITSMNSRLAALESQ